jgi:putative ABC transport system permease protein
MIIASGVATYIISLSTLDSLTLTQSNYYQAYRFADVFASLKRAPLSVVQRVRDIDGVREAEARVKAQINVEVPGFEDPVTGLLVSLPEDRPPLLNQLHMVRGRTPASDHPWEVVINEAFADAQHLAPGDTIVGIINGRREDLSIVGVALSPEFIYQIRPGDIFPDYERYAIMWMGYRGLSVAYDMDGAFNDLVLALDPEARPEAVIERLDALLETYGGQGAYTRKDQLSHRYITQEIVGLEAMAKIFPVIFLAFAAFLINFVTNRLIRAERDQIGVLKAFGYDNLTVGWHYVSVILIIVLAGAVAGIGFGAWAARGLTGIYIEFFRFPRLDYVLRPDVLITGVLVTLGAGLAGTLYAFRNAVRLSPAEAMRPDTPMVYRQSLVERLFGHRYLDQPTRMILRHIGRAPVKSGLTALGVALSTGLVMSGNFQEDAIDYMMWSHFNLAAREDVTVTFNELAGDEAEHELAALPGVLQVEGMRAVPVRFRYGNRSYRTAIQGFRSEAELHRLVDTSLQPVPPPPEGLLLTSYLGEEILGVRPGDSVTVEVLTGRRPVLDLPVTGFVEEYIGISGYMELDSLNRLMRDGHALTGGFLAIDPADQAQVFDELMRRPGVGAIAQRSQSIESFYESFAETILVFTFVNTLLAASIAFGAVYNSARIALAERSRELASLRVLGFTRAEIAYILIGELMLLVIVGVGFGFFVGRGICALFAEAISSDIYRVPLVLEPSTYAFGAAVVLGSGLISSIVIKRRLDDLDLVAVLKTTE